jgi:hypothetical protein
MALPSSVIRRGSRASQPAANLLADGSLYCITDEANKVEQTNGVVWEEFGQSFTSLSSPFTIPNADMLTLPTTALSILAAPGVGFVNVFRGAWIQTNLVAAYTNRNADGYLYIGYTDDDQVSLVSSYIPNDPGLSLDQLDALLATVGRMWFWLTPYQVAYDDWGTTSNALLVSDAENLPFVVKTTNGGLGNYTGGNVANQVVGRVWYDVLSLV